jgi:hypothetical protein
MLTIIYNDVVVFVRLKGITVKLTKDPVNSVLGIKIIDSIVNRNV